MSHSPHIMSSKEILASAEPLYKTLPNGPVPINCGDGRIPIDSDEPLYAKILGGRPALAWNFMALREYAQPGTNDKSLTEVDASFERQGAYRRAGLVGGVHSDQHAEGELAIKIDITDLDILIGCGRWQKGKEIADAAAEHIDKIIDRMKENAPTAISGLDRQAKRLATANATLAQRSLHDGAIGNPLILPSGRLVVVEAVKSGAHGIVLAGNHVEEDAVYNLVPRTTNDNHLSQKHFGADGWVNDQFFKANQDLLPGVGERIARLQDVIMAYATKLVLTGSFENVAVRTEAA